MIAICVITMAAEIPQYIFGVLDKELFDIQYQLICKISAEYNLNVEEVVSKCLPQKQSTNIQPLTTKKIEVIAKKNAPPPLEDELRCTARIWNRGRGGQCTRARMKGCDLCGNHRKLLETHGKLHHGRIHQPPPMDVFTGCKQVALYK
jgi:hypothetical protein